MLRNGVGLELAFNPGQLTTSHGTAMPASCSGNTVRSLPVRHARSTAAPEGKIHASHPANGVPSGSGLARPPHGSRNPTAAPRRFEVPPPPMAWGLVAGQAKKGAVGWWLCQETSRRARPRPAHRRPLRATVPAAANSFGGRVRHGIDVMPAPTRPVTPPVGAPPRGKPAEPEGSDHRACRAGLAASRPTKSRKMTSE